MAVEPAHAFKEAMDAYSRGDWDAALARFHPEIEWIPDTDVMPDPEVFHGRAGVRRFWETWAEAIAGMRLEVESCEAIGDERVLAITRAHGRGAGSGAAVASRSFAQLVEFEGGLAVRVWLFGDVRRALAQAGLDP